MSWLKAILIVVLFLCQLGRASSWICITWMGSQHFEFGWSNQHHIDFFCSADMGANCCIAAKQRPQPCIIPVEVSAYRNVRHSPSWSFRWDNRTHIEDIMEIPTFLSNHSSGSIRPETKSGSIAPTEGFSNGGSPSELFHKVKWQKSEKKMETSKVAQSDPRGK